MFLFDEIDQKHDTFPFFFVVLTCVKFFESISRYFKLNMGETFSSVFFKFRMQMPGLALINCGRD